VAQLARQADPLEFADRGARWNVSDKPERSFDQGVAWMTGAALEWRAADRVLEGAFEGIENTDYVLHFLVPKEYRLDAAEIAGNAAQTERRGDVVRLTFHSHSSDPVRWRLAF